MSATQTIAKASPESSNRSGGAVWRTIILWVNGNFSFVVLLNPTLDHCQLSTAWLIGVLAYWIGMALILRRRSDAPTVTDCIYLGVGQFAAVLACNYAFNVMEQYA